MTVTAEVSALLGTLQKSHLKSQKKMARIGTKISNAAAAALATEAAEVAPQLRTLQKRLSQMAKIGVKISKAVDTALAALNAEDAEAREGAGPTAPPARAAPPVRAIPTPPAPRPVTPPSAAPPPTAAPPATAQPATAPSTAPPAAAPSRKRQTAAPLATAPSTAPPDAAPSRKRLIEAAAGAAESPTAPPPAAAPSRKRPTAAPPATAPSTAPLAVAPSRKRSIEAPDERRFSGVKWHSPSNLWRATSCGFNLGDHAYKRDAALAVDAFLRVHDPGAPLNLPHLDERYDSTFLVPLDVRLTFDAEGRSVSLDARLTKVRYDPAHANVSRRVWRYRVKLLNAALASDLGLPAKLWDTVGGDSEFAACVIAAPAEQATAPRVPPAPEAAARQEPAARKKLKTVKTEIRQRTPPPDAYDAATDDDEAAALTCVPTPRKSPAKSPSTPSRLTPSRFEALPMFCVDALLTADVPICVAQENRKTGKSRARYALTTSATSCRAFLRLGGKKNDLQNDIVKGHVILDGFDDFSRHPIVASNTSMRKLKGEVSDSE